MEAIINIGMQEYRDQNAPLTRERVRESLEDNAVLVYDWRVANEGDRGCETFVAHVGKWTHAKAWEICAELNQDCIAQFDIDAGRGELVGPNAKDWGEFNPKYFELV